MIEKLQINKPGELKYAKNGNAIIDSSAKIVFKTIQIKKYDPSNFTIIIVRNQMGHISEQPIDLANYRTQFHIEGDKFILNVTQIDLFQAEGLFTTVAVRFECLENLPDLEVEVYYSKIDKKVPIEFEMHRH
jgi:hypothetical protein